MLKIIWRRLGIHRSSQVLYFSKLSPIKLELVPQNEKLTHRFLDYFEKCNGKSFPALHESGTSISNREMFEMDHKLCAKASTMANSDILKYLHFYMVTIPKQVTEFQFYETSTSILSQRINQLTPQQLVQFMYVVALKKKNYAAIKYMNKCLSSLSKADKLAALNVNDLLVVCLATFKTSCRIYNKQLLQLLEETLYANLHLLNDPPMFITMIKALRLNQCQSEELLNTISATVFFNSCYKLYNFTALCHILALYADYSYYDKELLTLFTDLALQQLKTFETMHKDSYFGENIRAKDIKRFLWVCSYLGHKLSNEDLQMVERKIIERINAHHYVDDADSLVDSTFYLWMLGQQATSLLPHCKHAVAIARSHKSKTKIRINMLLICMQLENVQLYKQFDCKAEAFKLDVKEQVPLRPLLARVFYALRGGLMGDIGVTRLEYDYQVPHINIVGITGYRKNIYKVFTLDVLDDVTAVKRPVEQRGRMANGPMQLKQRLLRRLQLNAIVIDGADIEDLNAEELTEFIKNELAIVS